MEPLTPAVFHILLSLYDEQRHGYGIMREIAGRTANKVNMGPGTLYGTLLRMTEAGLVEECASDSSEKRRRYYRLTSKGRIAAVAEAERLSSLLEAAYKKRLVRQPRLAL
jgi:DNA-binding PadR family transcriptional regulator